MAGLHFLLSSITSQFQRILFVIVAISLLQMLEAKTPSKCLGCRLNISIGIVYSETAGNPPSRVVSVCATAEGLTRLQLSNLQVNSKLRHITLQCNITLLKNLSFSEYYRAFLTKLGYSGFATDWHIGINTERGKLIGIGLTSSELYNNNTIIFCRYTGATGNSYKINNSGLACSEFSCRSKATKAPSMIRNFKVYIGSCFHNRVTHKSISLENGSSLYLDFHHKSMDIKLIERDKILLLIAFSVPRCILCKIHTDMDLPNRELPMVYDYSGSLETAPFLARKNFVSDTRQTSKNSSETGRNTHGFTFDDHKWAAWFFLAIAIFLQFLVPLFHLLASAGNNRSFRILSLYAFISFCTWLVFYICCTTLKCYQYGEVMHDLSIFCNVMLPVCYLILIGESCVSLELLSITSILEDVSIADYIENLRKALPGRYCTVKCYHYGWFHKKILSFKEKELFPIEYSVDLSADPPLSSNGMTRICLSMDIDFGDEETAKKYRELETEVLRTNFHEGKHVSVTHHDFIPGFHEIVCGYSSKGQRPYWMNPLFYVLVSVLGLSWPYRLMFWLAVKTKKYTIKKLIFSTYPRSEGLIHETANNTENAQSLVTHSTKKENAPSMKNFSQPFQPNTNLKASLGGTVFYIPNRFDKERRAIFIQRI